MDAPTIGTTTEPGGKQIFLTIRELRWMTGLGFVALAIEIMVFKFLS